MKKYRSVSFALILCAILTSCKNEKPQSNTPISNSPHGSSTSTTAPILKEVIEYVSFGDIYDVKFNGISPFLTIEFTPKPLHLPIWDDQEGNDGNRKSVKFKIEGEEYEEKIDSNNEFYWEMKPETKRSGKLRNGDTITFIPDEQTTNYDIEGKGSLSLGEIFDHAAGTTTKYVLADNEITISGADEYVYKPELATEEMVKFFADNDNSDFKYELKKAGFLYNYSGLVTVKGDGNVEFLEKNFVKAYCGIFPNVEQVSSSSLGYRFLLIFEVTAKQGSREPVTAFVGSYVNNPRTEGGEFKCVPNGSFDFKPGAYATLEELVKNEINLNEDYVWTEIS